MSDLVKSWLAGALTIALSATPALASDRPFNLGKIATAEEVAGWDIDVRPDGLGAPVGIGNAIDGEEIYAGQRCAACHGDLVRLLIDGLFWWVVRAHLTLTTR